MRRRTALTTMSSVVTGTVAGCLGSMRGGSSDPEDGMPSPDPAPAGTWPQVARDARNTRHAPAARGPRDDATVAWTSLGDRPMYPPVVDDGLYLTEAWTGGTALSVAPEDGSVQWSNASLPPMRWAPALHEDRMLVVTRAAGNLVRLHALDAATGDQAWVREEGITAAAGEHPPTGPTVRGGTVYLGSNRGLVACDAATGTVELTATLGKHVMDASGGPTWRTDWATPAVTADRAFTFDMNAAHGRTREVHAVDCATGDRAWTAELDVADGWSLKAHAVAGQERVFVLALDAHTSLTGDDSDWSGSERLFALDAATGDVAWTWGLPRKTLGPPAYADGTLYVAEWYPDADTGRLHAVDATTGTVTWTYRTDVGGVRSPTVADDTVYVVQGEQLGAIAADDGTRRWRLEIDAHPGSPVVVGDEMYVTTEPRRGKDSRLLAIREP
jgi:outer membrane protein assembly factor BamB